MNNTDKDKKLEKLKEILGTTIYFLCVMVFAFLILKFVGQRTEVIGRSMMPTLMDGDNLILNKISYRFHEPERFDIIVFPYRNGDHKNFIKRVVGLPGDTIQIDMDGVIYINGEVLEEGYGAEVIKDPGAAVNPITLNSDEYFVLGDNRNNSEDSRFSVGVVYRKEILGKVWIRITPFSTFGKVDK